ncbi:MAG TPA: anthranilate phosphoribosyltransferase [Bacteroidota bacterium]|nr:anthranilate phosphoribosyltransferase [Bacteroidota bacterium]
MKEFIQKIIKREHLTREEARSVMRTIMEGNATDAQIGSLLIALKMKGEHVDEIWGFVEVMREKSLKVHLDDPNAIDMCGTGGDGSGTFNISTAASFVVAGTGVTVAKHGNRSISSSCGSSDVLKALGVNVEISSERVEQCINTVGIGFLFAPLFHPAMKHAAKTRAELGIKTCFNILGPMTNPAGVKRQLVGAFDSATASTMAQVFSELDSAKVCVVHSADGMDEISLGSDTTVHEITRNEERKTYSIEARSFPLPPALRSELRGGDAATNASILLAILSGELGPRRDVVLANAAFGIYVSGKASSIPEAVDAAAMSIDSGKALGKLEAMKKFTQA